MIQFWKCIHFKWELWLTATRTLTCASTLNEWIRRPTCTLPPCAALPTPCFAITTPLKETITTFRTGCRFKSFRCSTVYTNNSCCIQARTASQSRSSTLKWTSAWILRKRKASLLTICKNSTLCSAQSTSPGALRWRPFRSSKQTNSCNPTGSCGRRQPAPTCSR